MLLKGINPDPAFPTGPIPATFNDIVGLLVYLGVAFLVLFREATRSGASLAARTPGRKYAKGSTA
jgi:hypothetical protein